MSKTELNKKAVREAVCPLGKAKLELFDTIIRGFMLEVRPTGLKTYCLKYLDASGRSRQLKIGDAAVITCSQARKKAANLLGAIALGRDPQVAREAVKAIPTFGQLLGAPL